MIGLGHLHLSLYKREFKAIFEEKYKEDRVIAVESNMPPRLIQRVFEGDRTFHQLTSEIVVIISLKACGNEDLEDMGSN